MPSTCQESRPHSALSSRFAETMRHSAQSEIQSRDFRPSRFTYVQSLVFGIAAAIAAFSAYLLFAAASGLPAGYLSLGAGVSIAKAVKTAARGQSGRRFQLTAVLLTYFVVAIAAIPVDVISAPSSSASTPTVSTLPISVTSATLPEGTAAHLTKTRFTKLLLTGSLSPLLRLRDPIRCAIDLVILFAGLSIAWRKSTVAPKRQIGESIEISSAIAGPNSSKPI